MNGRAQWVLPFGAALAIIGAAYSVGLRSGGEEVGISALERRVSKLDKEVSGLENRVQSLSGEQTLLEYQIKQLEEVLNERK